MKYTAEQLRYALEREYEYLCHDDFNPEEDMNQEQYREYLLPLTVEQLLSEAAVDDEHYTLDFFMEAWGE